jgi:hypothetical protein
MIRILTHFLVGFVAITQPLTILLQLLGIIDWPVMWLLLPVWVAIAVFLISNLGMLIGMVTLLVLGEFGFLFGDE